MKKVLFTATVDSHILQFHLPFLKLFKDKGYEVHVATNGNEEIPYCDKKHIISFERSPYKTNNLKAIKQLRKIINEEKYDIIHCHTPMGGVVTRLAAKQARKKYHTRVIYTAHGFHFYKGAPLLNWLLYYPVEKYLAKYTDTLITINNEDYELAKKKFSKRCFDIQYVPGVGIDEEKFNIKMTEKEKQDLRKSLGLKKDDFVMIYPAELNKNKNQLMIINAMGELTKKYKNIKVLLPGIDSYNGYYQRLVKEKRLEDYINFLGYRNDIPQLLKISNIALATSKREGLPLNVMEAMYEGLPIIATDCRGQRDLVKDGVSGYLIKDTNELIKKIEKVYKDKKNILGKESKKEIEQFLQSHIKEKLIEVYFRKCCIAYLRSTEIYNDSRAKKEIESYSKKYNVIVFGWNRKLEKIDIENNNSTNYFFFEKKAAYGSGIKNIFKMLNFNLWIKHQLKKNICKIDIIHACDFDTAYIAKYICEKYNKKLIYDIYDYYVDCHKLGFLKKIIEKKDIETINYADCVLLCIEKRKQQINKAHPKKIEIIHNSPWPIKTKVIKKTKTDKIIIGYFGILQDNRLLIEISEEIIKSNEFILYIGGFGKYEDYFQNVSKYYSNVKYYGALPYSDVLEKEQECDMLFATYNPMINNHKFSAPNKIYEAMALNKPIIVCRNTGIDELVLKEQIGEVINYNAKEFISASKKIGKSKKTDSSIVFEKKYSWNLMEERLNSIINNLRGNV